MIPNSPREDSMREKKAENQGYEYIIADYLASKLLPSH